MVAAYVNATSKQDIGRTASWNAVRAEIRAYRSAWADAAELATRAVDAADRSELLNLRADLRLILAGVLRGTGDAAGGDRAATEASCLFEAKGNLVGQATAHDFLGRHAVPKPFPRANRPS